MANQTYRVLELIRRFNNNEKVCIAQLKNETMWEGKSDKTVRRDLDIIKAVFPDTFHLIKGEQGCYKAVTNDLFSNIANAENISLLVQTFNIADRSNLFADLGIDAADKAILEKKIKDSQKTYLFKSKPFENATGDAALFKKLEQAIYHRKEILIDYRAADHISQHKVKPYKIVFMNENFYLASEVEHPDYQFSLFRISKIEEANTTGRNFHQNREIASFIKEMQTALARYTPGYREKLIEVVVEVAAAKAQYFRAKKHLPSQKIVEEKEDGSLVLSYRVTQIIEMDDLVKRWIPYMKVVEPLSLRERIHRDIGLYLDLG